MGRKHGNHGKRRKKSVAPSARPLTTALILLRAAELNIDLDTITIGMFFDIYTEKQRDSYDWPELATNYDILRR